MKLKLPDSVGSQQDLTTLFREIKDYSRWFAHEAIKKRVDAKHVSPAPVLSSSAQELIRGWDAGKTLTQSGLDELIKTLERYTTAAPLITLTLAAPPPKSLQLSLIAWCRTNIAPDVLVTFRFNATLLGGVVVHHGSRVFDWSFRRQLLAAREQFPEVLRRV